MTFRLLCLSLLAIPVFAPAADVLLKDDFSNPKLEHRRATRGEWKFADGVATCTQDDALYKKNKDHGPIISYQVPLQDGRVRFSFKPEGSKTVVFTANGEDGHVFRFVMSEAGTSIRAFPTDASGHKSISLGKEAPALKSGEWVPVEVDLRGSKAVVKIGEFSKSYDHPSLARPKTNITIGFSFGTVSVKDVVVEK
ncbi:MAG TPA: hypothetical protein VD994_05850 [Prosthecobacter sp.]|nr:hypothetical protein [Prosthecobacter sp.]